LQQRNFDIPKYNIITVAHYILIFDHSMITKLNSIIYSICIALSHFSCFLFLWFDDVMSYFKHGSFIFEILEYFSVHL
jgi:hypothetical protein